MFQLMDDLFSTNHTRDLGRWEKRRVQQMIGLAFQSPDIVRDAFEGKQPLGFTSDWLLRHDIPSAWDEQRALIATL